MGDSLDRLAVEVLDQGLPPFPDELRRGEEVPIARWSGERHGAVLVVRIYRDGVTIDCDCALLERMPDGSWNDPSSWAGWAWIDDPFVRPADGWDGDQVLWLGRRLEAEWPDEDPEEPPLPEGLSMTEGGAIIFTSPAGMPEAEARRLAEAAMDEYRARDEPDPEDLIFRAILGAASQHVAAIGVELGGRSSTVPIESPCGAFIVGIEGPGAATLQPLDGNGAPVGDSRPA